jgi:K(+)-stimulated pyrophosphate-energized sodium pump
MYIFVGMVKQEPGVLPDAGLAGLVAKLGLSAGLTADTYWWVLLAPLLIVAGGIIASLLAILYIRFSRRQEGMQTVLMNGTRLAALLTAVTTFVVIWVSPLSLNVFYQVILGLLAGVGIGFASEYFTSTGYKPTRELAKMNQSGPAIGVTEGMALGMLSTFMPVVFIATATIISFQLGGLLGVAFTAMGMLSFVAMTVAVDTYGPIADNAGGISSMAELPPEVREKTDKLDSIGNTTAAIGKGFAIGSAAFAALGLIAAYMWSAASSAAEVVLPQLPIVGSIVAADGSIIEMGAFVIAGLMLGAMVPYVFSALLIRGVSRTADILVQEVRRQFKEIPGILTGEGKPDYNRCITITAHGGLNKMFAPAMIAVLTPIVFGLIFGRFALGGFLIGALLSAIQLAIYCANSGGAMDNAKKYIEEGHFGGKNSEAHAAAVTGDTVGDPLKDTVGPSLDILIKLMSVIALVFASLFPLYPIFL